jgi:hypothetical protein
MSVREKIQTLCDKEPPYFQVLLVFSAARVEARWGTTGAAKCLTDEQLCDFIVEGKPPTTLTAPEINRLAGAFHALATMDREFPRAASTPS